MGACLFISIEVIRTGHNITRNLELLEKISSQGATWTETLKLVQGLSIIRDDFLTLDERNRNFEDSLRLIAERYSGTDNLFLQWYHDKLNDLHLHINHTVETESYTFDTSHLQEQKRIYSLFKGRENDYFWATSTCDGISWYASPTGDLFHQSLDSFLKQGKLKGVRRIFVFQDKTELDRFQTKLCFLLHKQSGFDYRVIGKDDFEAIIKNFGDRTLVRDFGIYGDHFVWETDPDEVTPVQLGEICVSNKRMAKYNQLFELLWDQSILIEINDLEIVDKYKGYRMDSFRKLFLSSTQNKTS